jgi:hypothetical protein
LACRSTYARDVEALGLKQTAQALRHTNSAGDDQPGEKQMNTIELEVQAVATGDEASQEVRTEVKPLVELSDAQLALIGGGTVAVSFY